MNKGKYGGVVVPMVTPITDDGRLDVAAVERIVRFFADYKVAPLLMGTTGEGNSVSGEDGRLFVETAVRAAEGRILIYAGLTGNCVSGQIGQAEAYTRLGADVIVATLPSYYPLTDVQMEAYYQHVADRITGPLMIYNITSTTHMSIPVSVVERLSRHPKIVGLKDSERDLDRMRQIIGWSKSRSDFAYFCGWAAQSENSLLLGGDGIVPSTGNFAPDLYQALYEAVMSGDHERAIQLQELTNRLGRIYQEGRTLGESLAALKVIMSVKGLCGKAVLPPLSRLTDEEEERIKRQVPCRD